MMVFAITRFGNETRRIQEIRACEASQLLVFVFTVFITWITISGKLLHLSHSYSGSSGAGTGIPLRSFQSHQWQRYRTLITREKYISFM
jgi:hypothetical protein